MKKKNNLIFMSIVIVDSFQLLFNDYKQILNDQENECKNIEILKVKFEADKKNKVLRTQQIKASTNYNNNVLKNEKLISNRVLDEILKLESKSKSESGSHEYQQDQQDKNEKTRQLYILLTKLGRTNSRYLKLPIQWMNLGTNAGLLEDLVVVMRTPTQIGIGASHMVSIEQLMIGFRKFMKIELETKGYIQSRFLFLSYLFITITNKLSQIQALDIDIDVEIGKKLQLAVELQGVSKRIGIFRDREDNVLYFYAIQGLFGNILYDPRVVQEINHLTFTNVTETKNMSTKISRISFPKYAIHFTKKEIALKIWNKEQTESHRSRTNGKIIEPGFICRFDRAIHAITSINVQNDTDTESRIEREEKKFVIEKSLKDIRSRMNHGIDDQITRQKYEAGLIIDIEKLANYYKSQDKKDIIFINELNTLLVMDDIPHECLLSCIHTTEQLNQFWLS